MANRGRSSSGSRRAVQRRQRHQRVQQLADAPAVERAHRDGRAQPQRVCVVGQRFLIRVVSLVHRQNDRLASAAQTLSDVLVAVGRARARVRDEQDGIRPVDGGVHLR